MPEGTSWFAKPPPPIQQLIGALQRHRIMFLYWATAVRPRTESNSLVGADRVYLDETRGWAQLFEDIGADGEFLSAHYDVLNRYAERATMAFGRGRAQRADDNYAASNHQQPFWILNPGGAAEYLEPTAERLLSSLYAARSLLHAELRVIVPAVARPQRCVRWTEAMRVPWEFLSQLDEALAKVWMHLFYEDRERDSSSLTSNGMNADAQPRTDDESAAERPLGIEASDSVNEASRSSDNATSTLETDKHSRIPRVDLNTCQLHFDGKTHQFGNTKPFALLERLARRPYSPVQIETILEDIWRKTGSYGTKATLQKTADRLRKEIKERGIEGLEVDGMSHFGLYVLKVSEKCQR